MRILVVVNPASGGSDPEALAGARKVLTDVGSVRSLEPRSQGSFAEEVLAASEGVDLVVVAGGDGTLNCAVNALEERLDELEFGVLPMGTGNDLARTLEIPKDATEAAEIIRAGGSRRIDVGVASSQQARRLFVNACIGGFPVEVDAAIDDDAKTRLGPFAFWWGAAKTVADLPTTRVEVDGIRVDNCIAVGVGNGRTCGGGMVVWPDADPSDGLLDACALPAKSIGDALKAGAKVKLGRHPGDEGVTTSRASSIHIESRPSIEINVDGELVGLETPASFTLERRLTLRVPLQ